MTVRALNRLATDVIAWHELHGRHDLPWQGTRNPYRIWLSEIMLQQTQVAAVIPYYQRFLQRFPDIAALAGATEETVLAAWSGLGYYSRARNLHCAARLIVERHAGQFPRAFEQILALPGVGRSTAAAIAAFAFGERQAILDGNVKRLFARFFAVDGYAGDSKVVATLWRHAEESLPDANVETYTQGLMDLGAAICTRSKPRCTTCPLAVNCKALAQQRVALLPARKAKRSLPSRRTVMLIVHHHGEVLLLKRPPVGVWSGLWCFPEVPAGIDANLYCQQSLGVCIDTPRRLADFGHGFTHFHLCITPLLAQVKNTRPRMTEAGQRWLTAQQALDAAIPAPVRKLLTKTFLDQLPSSQSTPVDLDE